MPSPLVSLRRVSKHFVLSGRNRRPLYRELLGFSGRGGSRPRALALDDLSLELPSGSRVALVGPNGAGKTTLLRTIAGIYHLSAGERVVQGPVACFFEAGAGMAPVLSVQDNVFVYGAVLGLSRAECAENLEAIIGFAELEKHRNSRVEHLSFGMQQRLFFAVVLATMQLGKARVFLFDEWLGGADSHFKQKGEAALQAVPIDGAIAIYASHELERLEKMCDQAVYLKEGKLRAFGATQEVFQLYRSEEAGAR